MAAGLVKDKMELSGLCACTCIHRYMKKPSTRSERKTGRGEKDLVTVSRLGQSDSWGKNLWVGG